jgi:hypothetical protein
MIIHDLPAPKFKLMESSFIPAIAEPVGTSYCSSYKSSYTATLQIVSRDWFLIAIESIVAVAVELHGWS